MRQPALHDRPVSSPKEREGNIMEHYKFVSACAAIAVTVGAFAIVAPPAHGKSRPVVVVANPDIVTRHIGYADLNLASSAGEVTLNRRVGGAISGLCQEATGV